MTKAPASHGPLVGRQKFPPGISRLAELQRGARLARELALQDRAQRYVRFANFGEGALKNDDGARPVIVNFEREEEWR